MRLYAPKHYWPDDDYPWPADYRPASPSEILSAARAHLDYEAAHQAAIEYLEQHPMSRDLTRSRGGYPDRGTTNAAVDAALGLTEGEHETS